MFKIKKAKELKKLKDFEFSILFFHADGCKYCADIKPVFQDRASKYPEIGFFAGEITVLSDYYMKFAEDTQEVQYKQGPDGQVITEPVFNEDGSPKMVKKAVFPSFYVHHTKAATEDNPHGFIGGFEGALEQELDSVLEMIRGAMNG